MNAVQNQKQNIDHALSFEDVSKLFPLPLSEAADILGVSTSVLKTLCNENGLERWPHRKYLAGKSIEDIKNEAAKEKSKALGGNSQGDRHKNNVSTGAVASSSPGSLVKDKTAKSSPDNPQQSGSKIIWRPYQIVASGLALEASSFSEEFKYGFPSSGLSRSTNKWWGDCGVNDGLSTAEGTTTSDVKDASESQVESNIMEHSGKNERDKVPLLSSIRKRALDEGQKALKSGALKKHGADQLEKEEKILLRRLFQAS
ncbi:hypothetical protein RND81_09G260000 [Saponaria officinalis]|uniref:RWP-RK domain-containing protein n=1 Tax=Saponaria officinalis TaxID=3572 RepID=A0AAW1IQQ4_SAPOF